MNAVDSFKLCMRHLPTGVTVITSGNDHGKEGVTINSFTSLSLDPLLVLFNLKKQSFCYDFFMSNKYFTVNILSDFQHEISNLFTKALPEKWDAVKTVANTKTLSPALEGCIAFVECEIYKFYDGGDHTIIVGKVLNAVYQNPEHTPLMYYNGGYFNPK